MDWRNAQPPWLSSSDCLSCTRRAVHANIAVARRFDLWRFPGEEPLAPDGFDLALTADLRAQRMRLSLLGALAERYGLASVVPVALRPRQCQLDS